MWENRKNQHPFNLPSTVNTAEQRAILFANNRMYERALISCETLGVSVQGIVAL